MSSAQSLPTPLKPDLEEVRDLVRRYNADEPAARQEMLQRLRDPQWIDRLGGDLSRQVEAALAGRLNALPTCQIEAIIAKAKQMRGELAHLSEPALLRLLADRVVTCWLHLHMLEFYAACIDRYESANHYEKLTDRAHRRYLASLSTLASVRKMGVRMIQVNVAQKQVVVGNVAVGGAKKKRKKIRIKNKNKMMIESHPREPDEIVGALADAKDMNI